MNENVRLTTGEKIGLALILIAIFGLFIAGITALLNLAWG